MKDERWPEIGFVGEKDGRWLEIGEAKVLDIGCGFWVWYFACGFGSEYGLIVLIQNYVVLVKNDVVLDQHTIHVTIVNSTSAIFNGEGLGD